MKHNRLTNILIKTKKKLSDNRLARAGPRSEPTTYEVVQINGSFRRSDDAPRCVKSNSLTTGVQVIRRRGRDDGIPLHTVTGNDIVIIFIKLIKIF